MHENPHTTAFVHCALLGAILIATVATLSWRSAKAWDWKGTYPMSQDVPFQFLLSLRTGAAAPKAQLAPTCTGCLLQMTKPTTAATWVQTYLEEKR
jgi:hypothetical protein